ncbi:3-hydroxyacyl-CoA dehydrogenase family protein [Rickettsia endosymbiont of Proechinophthirus fluctus]|uniref:3-hydroxyacyl-CoA dehydrogenase family protein n=1 Tax=Rickettsia endosymbiont of Proechinophthirus fluctus TaxID=1462733 RepID=UPI002092FF0F|nr:3-hydroxyacyl-CoA dehydrogenase family protein [Rickettsia endosymbiont of Proechinophthirus fluctus]
MKDSKRIYQIILNLGSLLRISSIRQDNMELLELIIDPMIKAEVIERVSEFLTKTLGQIIVKCNDTPGFIANRVGYFLLELVARKAISQNLDVATIDKIFITFLGLRSTGMFSLYDLIGYDIMKLISSS